MQAACIARRLRSPSGRSPRNPAISLIGGAAFASPRRKPEPARAVRAVAGQQCLRLTAAD